jgi:hypothetical protein
MNSKHGLFALVVIVSMALTLSAPVALAEEPAPQLPGGVTVSRPYLDALTYWYKQITPDDWATHLNWALSPATSGGAGASQHVILTGVPADTWWIDAWRLELDGTWTNAGSGWSFHVVGQAPNPVHGNLMRQGDLPGVYVLRACDRTGAVLVGGPRLLVVTWAGDAAQTFDLPSLPAPAAEQLDQIKM